MCFCSLLLRKKILLDFLGFCSGTFLILQILLLEISSVVMFCVYE